MRKVILACMIGNAIEWYDFVIYGYFADVIGQLFFPSSDPFARLMAALGVFAAGFISRPVGAVIFGHIGDKVSRKTALMLSIYVMAIPTMLIGCLPTYESIGFWAPVFLTILRIMQGLAIGGEFTGSMVFMVEHAPDGQRGLAGGWATFSMVVGVIAGSAIATFFLSVLTKDQIMTWGWRLPFVFSILGTLVGTYMRRNLADPERYLEEKKKRKNHDIIPLKSLFTEHGGKIFTVVMVDFLSAVGFFLLVIFLPNYFKGEMFLGLPSHTGQIINTINMIVFAAVLPLSGWLSDRLGRKFMLRYPPLMLVLFAYPLFTLFPEGPFFEPLFAQMSLVILMGLFFGTIPATIAEIFPTNVRFSGLSIAHNLSMALFGGTAPIMATKLVGYTGDLSSPAYLLMISAALTMVGTKMFKDMAWSKLP